MFFAGDGAGAGVWAAFGFGWASLTDLFQPAIFCPARICWATVGIGIVAAELLERCTFWAGVLITFRVPGKVFPAPSAVGPLCLVPSHACKHALPGSE